MFTTWVLHLVDSEVVSPVYQEEPGLCCMPFSCSTLQGKECFWDACSVSLTGFSHFTAGAGGMEGVGLQLGLMAPYLCALCIVGRQDAGAKKSTRQASLALLCCWAFLKEWDGTEPLGSACCWISKERKLQEEHVTFCPSSVMAEWKNLLSSSPELLLETVLLLRPCASCF